MTSIAEFMDYRTKLGFDKKQECIFAVDIEFSPPRCLQEIGPRSRRLGKTCMP
jgi:hypothetical protein